MGDTRIPRVTRLMSTYIFSLSPSLAASIWFAATLRGERNMCTRILVLKALWTFCRDYGYTKRRGHSTHVCTAGTVILDRADLLTVIHSGSGWLGLSVSVLLRLSPAPSCNGVLCSMRRFIP